LATWLFLAALVAGALGIWLLLRSRSARQEAGLPPGRLTYVDTGAWDRCERPLFSDRYRLTGRPDYLVKGPQGLVPVEVKSHTAPQVPYAAHILQLAAYCLLVEDQEGRAPPYGIIKYEDSAFEVEFSSELRDELLATLDSMRRDLGAREVERSHEEAGRCYGCGYRTECDQRLA
jgi:CRISPR-associated exonuclease Cas4